MGYSSGPETLEKPRILCLHGGGVSARIFRLQARRLASCLAPHFRLVFVDGPFWSEMHPDLRRVYGQMGPCRQWCSPLLPPNATIDHPDHAAAVDMIENCLEAVIKSDPGTGDWVGLLGFSQGARLAVSILLENQLRRTETSPRDFHRGIQPPFTGVNWKFGVLMAGRGPPYALRPQIQTNQFFEPIRSIPVGPSVTVQAVSKVAFPHPLTTPTVHVHGLQDEGLAFHRQLLHQYVAPDQAMLVEWNGKHRIPIQTMDVEAVARATLHTARLADRWHLETSRDGDLASWY